MKIKDNSIVHNNKKYPITRYNLDVLKKYSNTTSPKEQEKLKKQLSIVVLDI